MIDEIIETFDLIDPWRANHTDERKYTWRQHSPIKQSRLDYFLVTEDIFALTKNSKIIPGYKTDHSAITLTFCATLGKRGRGYWKFNSQHLLDNNYVEKVKTCLRDTLEEYAIPGENLDDLLNVQLKCNDQLFFEIIKMKIRSITIEYSITKSKRER